MSNEVKKLQRDLAAEKRKLADANAGMNSWAEEKKTLEDKVETLLQRNADMTKTINTLKNVGNDVCSALDKAIGVLEAQEMQQQQTNPDYKISSIKALAATLAASKFKFRNTTDLVVVEDDFDMLANSLLSPDSRAGSTSRGGDDGSPGAVMTLPAP